MTTAAPGGQREILVFIYDAKMSGLPDSGHLSGARLLGDVATEPRFDLIDLGTHVALAPGGSVSVRGELYAVEPALLAKIDVENAPRLLLRSRVRLDDGREVEAHTLASDQVRGRRRIRSGDYRAQLAPSAPVRQAGAWSQWAKGRRR